jgi:hypothetical protein
MAEPLTPTRGARPNPPVLDITPLELMSVLNQVAEARGQPPAMILVLIDFGRVRLRGSLEDCLQERPD